MRVYEYSKQINVPVKTVMQFLVDNGFIFKSHMAVLTDESRAILDKKFGPLPLLEEPAIKDSPVLVSESKRAEEVLQESRPTTVALSANVTSLPEASEQHSIYLEQQSIADFALATGKSVNEIILALLRLGHVSSKNQLLTESLVAKLAKYYDIAIKTKDQLSKQQSVGSVNKHNVDGVDLRPRLPIAVVIGHVDHGKTSLLDFIRKTRVASKEKGGITQHMGAYRVKTNFGDLVFLDTPGHEAFSKMRQRGVRIADIAVLVVAADDGVMPQTIEAIKHARQMNVPIVVAANKMDKVSPERLDVIKRQLSQHDVLVEDWGGSVVLAPISAKTGQGVSELLDMIILQTQLMDLRADWAGTAKGFVLESTLERGLGPVATIILQHGILHLADYFTCGSTSGRVTSITDSYGTKLSTVEPSIPVRVGGFSSMPEAGDFFNVIEKNEYKKVVAQEEKKGSAGKKFLQTDAINLIIKTDTNSSREALLGVIEAISKKINKQFSIIYASAGDISEGDVELAYTTGAIIIGLHVKPEIKALQLAQARKVTISLYDVIYRLIEELEHKYQEKVQAALVKTKIGEARVLKIFDIKGVGVIAGCIVTEGRISRDGVAVVWRGRQKIGEGKIVSLQRDKKTVKEAHAGFECGFLVEGVTDWNPDDRVECYLSLPVGATK